MDRIEIYQGRGLLKRSQRWRWRYVAGGNNARLATGAESYRNQDDALAGMRRVCNLPEPIPGQDGWQILVPEKGVQHAWRVFTGEDNSVIVQILL